eukprot:SAG22_NODE_1321_length_4757_cov_1.980678_1_plen_319_part_00
MQPMQMPDGANPADYPPPGINLVGRRGKKPPPAIRLSDEKFNFAAAGGMSEAERESMLAWQREQPMLEAVKTCGHATVRDSGSYELPAQISSYMLIGRRVDAENVARLRELGVTHILNCAATDAEVAAANAGSGPFHDDPSMRWAGFAALDMDGYQLLEQHLADARGYIDQARLAGGRVLVHCEQAINRSAAICCAYLMLHERATLLTAVRHVRRRRGMILQNEGFAVELTRLAFQEGLADPDPTEQLATLGESPSMPIGGQDPRLAAIGALAGGGGGAGGDDDGGGGGDDDMPLSPDLRDMATPKTTRGAAPTMMFG